jgi:hypothetical protein
VYKELYNKNFPAWIKVLCLSIAVAFSPLKSFSEVPINQTALISVLFEQYQLIRDYAILNREYVELTEQCLELDIGGQSPSPECSEIINGLLNGKIKHAYKEMRKSMALMSPEFNGDSRRKNSLYSASEEIYYDGLMFTAKPEHRLRFSIFSFSIQNPEPIDPIGKKKIRKFLSNWKIESCSAYFKSLSVDNSYDVCNRFLLQYDRRAFLNSIKPEQRASFYRLSLNYEKWMAQRWQAFEVAAENSYLDQVQKYPVLLLLDHSPSSSAEWIKPIKKMKKILAGYLVPGTNTEYVNTRMKDAAGGKLNRTNLAETIGHLLPLLKHSTFLDRAIARSERKTNFSKAELERTVSQALRKFEHDEKVKNGIEQTVSFVVTTGCMFIPVGRVLSIASMAIRRGSCLLVTQGASTIYFSTYGLINDTLSIRRYLSAIDKLEGYGDIEEIRSSYFLEIFRKTFLYDVTSR